MSSFPMCMALCTFSLFYNCLLVVIIILLSLSQETAQSRFSFAVVLAVIH